MKDSGKRQLDRIGDDRWVQAKRVSEMTPEELGERNRETMKRNHAEIGKLIRTPVERP